MEKPILFKSDMVRAILDGRKTQTRRIIKLPRFVDEHDGEVAVWSLGKKPASWESNEFAFMDYAWPIETYPTYAKCSYGKVGDKLWVRETVDNSPEHSNFYWRADKKGVGSHAYNWILARGWRNKKVISSIHMPKCIARIWLEVTRVRVEKIRNIRDVDAKAEGVIVRNIGDRHYHAFRNLWDSINKKRGYGWDKNPFVWVIEFKVIKP